MWLIAALLPPLSFGGGKITGERTFEYTDGTDSFNYDTHCYTSIERLHYLVASISMRTDAPNNLPIPGSIVLGTRYITEVRALSIAETGGAFNQYEINYENKIAFLVTLNDGSVLLIINILSKVSSGSSNLPPRSPSLMRNGLVNIDFNSAVNGEGTAFASDLSQAPSPNPYFVIESHQAIVMLSDFLPQYEGEIDLTDQHGHSLVIRYIVLEVF